MSARADPCGGRSAMIVPTATSPKPTASQAVRLRSEDMLDALADALPDLGCSFYRTDGYVSAGLGAAFAHVGRSIDRMQRRQVHSALSGACGQTARALGRSLADVARAAADV